MIFVDHREKKSIVPDELQKLGVPIKFLQLEVGDYIIAGHENVCVDVIERKETKDYIQSLTSGHLNNQLYAMSKKYGHSLLLIEGSISAGLFESGTSRHAYLSSIVGSFMKRAPDGKSGVISIIQVDTSYDTALALKFMHDKNYDPEGLVRLPKLNPLKFSQDEIVLVMLMSIPGIGKKLALSVLKDFHTLQNVANATVEELINIPKIGKKKAKDIFEFFRFYYSE